MSNNTLNMQIFTIIGQLEELVDSSPRPKLGGAAKRIVDVDEVMDLLGDLKVTIPEDIRRANSVILESQSMIDNADDNARDIVAQAQEQSDAIIAGANATANEIIAKARREYERLVSEEEVYAEAQRRADLLAKKAEANAAMVFDNARCYADDVLKDLENFLGEYRQLVAINRKDLGASTVAGQEPQQAQPIQNGYQQQPAPQAQYAAQVQQPVSAPMQSVPAQPAQAAEATKPVPVVKPKHKFFKEEEFEDDEYEDDDYEDDDEDDGKIGIFGRLFGRKKKDIEFDDDDFDDEE